MFFGRRHTRVAPRTDNTVGGFYGEDGADLEHGPRLTAASGAQVEQGSALDLSLDIAERGELDAMGILDQGARQDYLQRRRAVGYQAQAAGLQSQAGAVDLRSGSETLDFLGGALRQGGNYLKTLQRGGGAKL